MKIYKKTTVMDMRFEMSQAARKVIEKLNSGGRVYMSRSSRDAFYCYVNRHGWEGANIRVADHGNESREKWFIRYDDYYFRGNRGIYCEESYIESFSKDFEDMYAELISVHSDEIAYSLAGHE